MGAMIKLFGNNGFGVPLSILIDADAAADTATKYGIDVADLNQRSVWVSSPDLEAEYVQALGSMVVWAAIESSPLFSRNERGNCAATGSAGARTDADVSAFCRRSKYKVRAAMVVAKLLSAQNAATVQSLNRLLGEIAVPQ